MDKNKIWLTVLENLKVSISSANFATWFRSTFIVHFKKIDKDRQIVEIGCPSPFTGKTIENRYYGLIKSALDQITGKKNDLVFIVKQIERPKTGEAKKEPLFEVKKEKSEVVEAIKRISLRPDFNFDNFAVSSSNQMAHAAAIAVAQSPGKAYNPLFLYGGVGVGKTHLMQAIAQAVLTRNPRTKIVYCMSEEFTNEIVNAIREKTTKEFKQKYRSARILLIDDIQFIAGKTAVQEEFFHTFNAIWRAGGQIVLTSDRKPEEINKLEDRLKSRFEGGLTIDIQPPDFELRTAILLIKAQQREIKLPMDVAQLIASNITSIRKMEGFLIRLISESQTRGLPITSELTQALLGQTNSSNQPVINRPTLKETLRGCCVYFKFKQSEILGPKRDKPLALARQILMYFLRMELNMSYEEIGRFLEGRDHTTIMHGVNKITKLLSESEDIRVDMAGMKKEICR